MLTCVRWLSLLGKLPQVCALVTFKAQQGATPHPRPFFVHGSITIHGRATEIRSERAIPGRCIRSPASIRKEHRIACTDASHSLEDDACLCNGTRTTAVEQCLTQKRRKKRVNMRTSLGSSSACIFWRRERRAGEVGHGKTLPTPTY